MRLHWQFSIAANGNLYFTSRTGAADTDGLYIARFADGEYREPEFQNLRAESPFIAPDESYLIWDSEREGGFGGSDLYVSFKQKDGTVIEVGGSRMTGIDLNCPVWINRVPAPDGEYQKGWSKISVKNGIIVKK